MLNEIVIDNSKDDDQVNRHKPSPDSNASFRTVHSNVALLGHWTKLPGHTSVEQIVGVGSEDSASKSSKTSALLSDILQIFEKELLSQKSIIRWWVAKWGQIIEPI